MDEHQTDKTLETLADLFLTNPGDTKPPHHHEAPQAPAHPSATELDGPPPIRLRPKPSTISPPNPAGQAGFVHRDHKPNNSDQPGPIAGAIRPHPGTTRATSTTNCKPPVEAVFAGNLPGFGGPWIIQYAHYLALQYGPVAIIQIDDDTIDVEVVSTADDNLLPSHTGLKSSAANATVTLQACLEELTQLSTTPIQGWLVRFADPISDTSLQRAGDFSKWTIVSGADEPAVISSYQLLKQLIHQPSQLEHHVGLMVMGSDEQESHVAAEKLNATAADFLDSPVGLIGHQKKMVPVSHRVVGSFNACKEHWLALSSFLKSLPVTPRQDGFNHDGASTASRPAITEPTTHDKDQTRAKHQPAQPIASPGPLQADTHTRSSPTTHIQIEPLETILPELASYLPGTIPLEARCPQYPDTQLVVDESGRLHVLARCGGYQGDTPGSDPVRRDPDTHMQELLNQAMVELMAANAWAREHLGLIQLTQRQCRIDPSTSPRTHLFTHNAKAAARFGRHDDIQFHLLRQVHVGSHHTWFCTELN